MKCFDELKRVDDPQSSGSTQHFRADRTILLTDKEAIRKRWAKDADGVLNRPSSVGDEAVTDYHRWN